MRAAEAVDILILTTFVRTSLMDLAWPGLHLEGVRVHGCSNGALALQVGAPKCHPCPVGLKQYHTTKLAWRKALRVGAVRKLLVVLVMVAGSVLLSGLRHSNPDAASISHSYLQACTCTTYTSSWTIPGHHFVGTKVSRDLDQDAQNPKFPHDA